MNRSLTQLPKRICRNGSVRNGSCFISQKDAAAIELFGKENRCIDQSIAAKAVSGKDRKSVSGRTERPFRETTDRPFRKRTFSKPSRSFDRPRPHSREEHESSPREREPAPRRFYERFSPAKKRGANPKKRPFSPRRTDRE